MSVPSDILEGLRDAVNAIDGLTGKVGNKWLPDMPYGTVLIRPGPWRPTQRDSHHQEWSMEAELWVRSKLVGDDDETGLQPFKKVCDDGHGLMQAIIASVKFNPGAGSVAAKLIRVDARPWYPPKTGTGQAAGVRIGVRLAWREAR